MYQTTGLVVKERFVDAIKIKVSGFECGRLKSVKNIASGVAVEAKYRMLWNIQRR